MNFMPNVLTLSNLLLGSLSLMWTISGNYRAAAVFILAAMVLDGLDGRVARRLGTCSELGKELDSLADLVSFGVAPALLMFVMLPNRPDEMAGYSLLLGIASLAFILCGAYRLARFNVLNIHEYYVGIPITIAGSILALLALVIPQVSAWFFIIVMFLFAFLMVSRFKVPKY